MTDNLHIPRRLEGEQEVKSNPNWQKPPEAGVNSLEEVSLEAVINILITRGICTEAELLAEENRLRASEETTASTYFTPVQTYSERHEHRHQNYDGNRLRRWASKRHWSRQLGTLLFGWKWHRKKREQKI